MDKRVTEYLAWLNNQFENALDAADSDVPSEYQEGLTDASTEPKQPSATSSTSRNNDAQTEKEAYHERNRYG